MKVFTEQYFFDRFWQRSPYNPKNRHGNPKVPPRILGMVNFSLEGLKQTLKTFLNETSDGQPGIYDYHKNLLQIAIARWEKYRRQRVNLPKDAEPIGDFAEQINKARARVKVTEQELRIINKMIADLEVKQEEHQTAHKKRTERFTRLAGKMLNGRLVMFGGREVFQDDEGENRFKDDESLVRDYIARERAERLEKFNK